MIATEIKERLSMRDLADRYGLDVNQAGFADCPFHDEKTASLKIYEEVGRGFFCFGCNKGGDVIKFVQLLFNLSFPQALERMKHDFGIRGSSDPGELLKWKRERRAKKIEKQREELYLISVAAHCAKFRAAAIGAVPFSDEHVLAVNKLFYYNYLFDSLVYGSAKKGGNLNV